MPSIILAWILSLQLLLSMLISPADITPRRQPVPSGNSVQESRLFWGLIDPELSLWFSRIPHSARVTDAPVLWDFSWRGFLAALFAQPIIKEDVTHAPQI